jgi:flagellar hook protein FlgE
VSMGAFSAALSGMNATQQDLAVVGNNLANINTVGYKASSVTFADLVSQSVGGTSVNPMQSGLGVTTGSISSNFSQGGLQSTGVATDVAIQGQGFLVVGSGSNQSFTRAGNLSFDPTGKLITSDGQAVQGYTTVDPLTGLIVTSGTPSDIIVPAGVLHPPTPTSTMETMTNLNSGSAVGAVFNSSVQVYDSLGIAHSATIKFTETGAGAWSYSMSVPGADVTGGTAGTPSVIATGTLGFNNLGVLTAVNGGAVANVTVTGPAWANGAAATNITWQMVDPTSGSPTVSNYASTSATASVMQNGSAAGSVSGITINPDGTITAAYGSGQSATVAQIALANFTNPEGLVKLGSNNYGESYASGIPNIGIPGTAGRGTLIGSSLEQSNVDMAQEFTNMILAQRGYEANSKSITVSDQMLQDTLNLIR